MITREKIARWLFPDIAKNAARYRFLLSELEESRWWLSEFQDIGDALQRIIDRDFEHWRSLIDDQFIKTTASITYFRETLRRRNAAQPGGRAHPLAKRGSPDAPRSGLYRVFWKSGGSSLAAIGILSNGDRWIAPTNWVTPGTMASDGEWGDVKRLEPIDADGIDRLKEDLVRVLDANSRQAFCIQQCAASIGPDTVGTIDGLPRAVKHLVNQLQQSCEHLASAIVEVVGDVMVDADISYPAGRAAGPMIEYDTEELRQKIVAALSMPQAAEGVSNG